MNTVTLGGSPLQVDGHFLQKGETAPAFTLVNKDLEDISYSAWDGKRKVLNIFPSIDTPTCAKSVRYFNNDAAYFKNTVVLCISADLPFAQQRFCGVEGLKNVLTLSTMRNRNFLMDYGVAFVNGPLLGLCARAVVVLDAYNRVLHSELVKEIQDEPDYKAALKALA